MEQVKKQTAVDWYYDQTVVQGKTNYIELLSQAKAIDKELVKELVKEVQLITIQTLIVKHPNIMKYFEDFYLNDTP